jgi:hypothetical protein
MEQATEQAIRLVETSGLEPPTLLTRHARSLRVVEGNDQARRFYWRQGFRPDGSTKTATMSGAEAIEVRYRMSLQ